MHYALLTYQLFKAGKIKNKRNDGDFVAVLSDIYNIVMPSFVIQKHRATTLHYDFRLEVDGVLKSWVVPKGPSTDPGVKRLAIMTDDHPVEYAGFEGTIPQGEYGAGTVIVWDKGTYSNLKEGNSPSVSDGIVNGHITFRLEGQKLKGGYSLTRFGRGEGKQWLLVKMDDEEADARRNPVSTEPESVVSGKTVEDLEDKNR